MHAFVNFDFGFRDHGYTQLSQMFWQQLCWMKAGSYLAENDYLVFVTQIRNSLYRYEVLPQVR